MAVADVQRQVVAVRTGEVPMNSPRGRIAEQRQSGERSSESAGSDQNAKGRAGEKIEHENQVKRPDTPVYGRVVSRIGHKMCARRKQAEPRTERLVGMTRKPLTRSLERRSCT